MRSPAARDTQTLDIAAAVLGAATVWGLVVGVAAIVMSSLGALDAGDQAALPFVFGGYLVTVCGWLLAGRLRSR